jgi:Fe-S oxidoreductase/FAD/FMN-containing dehydrogenase
MITQEKAFLRQHFGDRVSFHRIERKLYGHDIASVPSIIKILVGNTIPDAVVQPETEEELVDLVKWAAQHKIPLTPRGKASSGYGGVLPVKHGIVIDMYRFNKIHNINKKELTVTVDAAVVWEKLDKKIMKEGLTLRLYPSSYPAATVGGWLAQGGTGIGSFESGWFHENVISARVVLPDGSIKELNGDELNLISGAEGITGIISQVTLKVKPLEELDIVTIGCAHPEDMQNLIQSFITEKLPIWSLTFINPRMAELKNKAPVLEHFEHPVEQQVLLPASYIVTIAFRKKDNEIIHSKLPPLLKENQAEILSQIIAEHEWKNRFKIMMVKRLGPSLIPTEFVVPLSNLSEVLAQIDQKINQPVVKEGVVIQKGMNGEPEVVILGFIPGDERKFEYNLVFPLALSIMKIAEKYGGRPYSAGLYFSNKANQIYGKKTVADIKAFKKKIDRKNILNPGKIIGEGILRIAMGIADFFEPILRPIGNTVVTHIGERPTKAVRDIPAEVAWYAYGCSQCGYCIDECDQFYGRKWESQSPRGKWYWLREYMHGKEEWNQFMVDTILVCTTCELCNLRCSASLPIEPSWMKLRGILVNDERKMTFPPFEMMAASLRKEGDIWAAYRKDRINWFPPDLLEKHGPDHKAKIAYFAGCTASHVETDIAMAAVRLLDAAGIDFTYLGNKDNCCGTPMMVCGKWDVFEETMRNNIQNMKDAGVETVITSCPACDMMWRHYYPIWAKKLGIEFNIQTKHYSEIIAEKINNDNFTFPEKPDKKVTVTLHDSCHIGRVSSIYDAPRTLIKAIPGVKLVEMEHNREWAHCCGSVLTLIKDPPIAADIGDVRINEAVESGAEKLLAICPCCEFQFRVTADKKGSTIETIDLARFAASTLGYNFPDPNPEVRKNWAVFEAMIALMTPQGFADLMATMFPELINAMPFGMGSMMRFMGKIPGALTLIKPMFPILFPRLLPTMMPKVMPVMLQKVGERIPMPQYMLEQMPDLLPKVMDNLMPQMIGDVIPLVTQPMIDFLRGKGKK